MIFFMTKGFKSGFVTEFLIKLDFIGQGVKLFKRYGEYFK